MKIVVKTAANRHYFAFDYLVFLSSMTLELSHVALFGGLGSHHAPDHFLLCPRPPQSPPRRLNAAILLEVIHCNNCLQMRPKNMRESKEKITGGNSKEWKW
ncbi:hypothetical protein SADUNF_Sadunf15G0053100 [Salix dunnii]|uniref:Uncharacterized protein n=1 Tax=Salix dunnii TaxID=1413687 RepID=A0A835JDL6_9ROSI|nr:hypothetical protein SADUNF_Sadunf15G0053100 [Salix dunnii]